MLEERIYDYALSIPDKMLGKGEVRYMFLINYCLARKFGGKDYKKRLYSVQWEAFHPKYNLAVAVLEDRLEEACALMKSEAVKQSIDKECYLSWPLFRQFRSSPEFQRQFEAIYGTECQSGVIQNAESELFTMKCEVSIAESVDPIADGSVSETGD